MCFEVLQQKKKIIVRIIEDPTNASDITPFVSQYTSVLQKAKEKSSEKTLTVLFDLRKLTVSLFSPKARFISQLLSFFTAHQKLSERTLLASAVLFSPGSSLLTATISNAVSLNPGEVPFFISTSLDKCKMFLVQHIKSS